MSREVFNYDGLIVGDVTEMAATIAVSQEIKRGDLLVSATTDGVPAVGFSKATVNPSTGKLTVTGAVTAVSLTDYVYAIAAEDVTTTSSATAKTSVYKNGYFNKAKVGLPSEFAEGNRLALSVQGIILSDGKSGDIS